MIQCEGCRCWVQAGTKYITDYLINVNNEDDPWYREECEGNRLPKIIELVPQDYQSSKNKSKQVGRNKIKLQERNNEHRLKRKKVSSSFIHAFSQKRRSFEELFIIIRILIVLVMNSYTEALPLNYLKL